MDYKTRCLLKYVAIGCGATFVVCAAIGILCPLVACADAGVAFTWDMFRADVVAAFSTLGAGVGALVWLYDFK